MKRLTSFLLPLLILSASCSGPESDSRPGVEIIRLDQALRSDSLTPELYEATDAWLLATRGSYPADSRERDSLVRSETASSAWRIFGPDVDSLLPPLSDATKKLGGMDGLPSTIYGIISPYNQSVVVVDTIILVALNHYLGADYEGYTSMPAYIARNKTLARLPLDVAEAWTATRVPFSDSIPSPSLLMRMAYDGAILASVADKLGVEDGPLLMGWTDEQWADAVAHESEAWKRIVSTNLLFSDDQAVIARMISPAPSSPDVSPDAPGRLGRFIGLRMLRASALSPDSVLEKKDYLSPEIMAPYARMMSR